MSRLLYLRVISKQKETDNTLQTRQSGVASVVFHLTWHASQSASKQRKLPEADSALDMLQFAGIDLGAVAPAVGMTDAGRTYKPMSKGTVFLHSHCATS